MEARGKKILTLTGIVELLFGFLSILLIIILLQRGDVPRFLEMQGKEALAGLLRLYVLYGMNVVAGVLGFVWNDEPKNAPILMILGFLLILTVVYMYIMFDATTGGLVSCAVNLVVACLYFLGATLNYASYKDVLEVEAKPKKKSTKAKK